METYRAALQKLFCMSQCTFSQPVPLPTQVIENMAQKRAEVTGSDLNALTPGAFPVQSSGSA